MRKVGARILLCLMLVIALVTSTLTAFAEPNTTETPEGLDLSKFITVDLKDVGGVYDGNFYMKNGLKYLFLYKDDDSYYRFVNERIKVDNPEEGEDEYFDGQVLRKINTSDINSFVSNTDNYISSTYTGGKEYTLIDGTVQLKERCENKSFYAFFCRGTELIYAGYYNSFDDLSKYSKITFTVQLPQLNISVEKGDGCAKINVEFSSEDGVRSVLCRYSDGAVKEEYTVPDSDIYKGKYTFEVTSNETFKIEGYNNYFYSVDEEHTSKEVVVDCVSQTAPELVSNKTSNKAPKVTFSKLPKSALVNSDVEITMYSDKPAKLVFNGQASDGYVKKMKVKVTCNGKYAYSASDKDSNQKSGKLNVKFFKNGRAFDDEDRDNFWNNPNSPISTITSKLPQTGSVGWYWMIAFGVALVGVGGFVVFKATKSRKNKGIENK